MNFYQKMMLDTFSQSRQVDPIAGFVWIVVGLLALFLSGTGGAFADQCLNDIAGFNNPTCTANDVVISRINTTDGTEFCIDGEDVTLPLEAEFVAQSVERYDAGIYVALDGGDAVHAVTNPPGCERWFLDKIGTSAPPVDVLGGDGPYWNLETDDPNDVCGDLRKNETNIKELGSLTFVCQDTTGDGILDIGTCLSWDNNDKETCEGLDDTVPGTPSKCRCEPVNVGNIFVRLSAKLEVIKDLIPSDDTGRFDLQVDEMDEAQDVGDGGTTSVVVLDLGTVDSPDFVHSFGETVGQTPTNPTVLSNYDISFECVDRGSNPETFQGGAPFTGTGAGPHDITFANKDDIVCTITNELRVGTLTVIKTVINDNGGTKVASDFNIDLGGTTGTTTTGTESPGETFTFLVGTSFSVTETPLAGYAPSYSGDCSGTIEAGVNKTCTITNDDISPTLKLVKTIINNNGGTVTDENAFGLKVDGGAVLHNAVN
ncbi:MAG: hypothetical protein ACU84J_02410, partial [Gammaproteobacteria bacterium]